jgi:hypothetical protein
MVECSMCTCDLMLLVQQLCQNGISDIHCLLQHHQDFRFRNKQSPHKDPSFLFHLKPYIIKTELRNNIQNAL